MAKKRSPILKKRNRDRRRKKKSVSEVQSTPPQSSKVYGLEKSIADLEKMDAEDSSELQPAITIARKRADKIAKSDHNISLARFYSTIDQVSDNRRNRELAGSYIKVVDGIIHELTRDVGHKRKQNKQLKHEQTTLGKVDPNARWVYLALKTEPYGINVALNKLEAIAKTGQKSVNKPVKKKYIALVDRLETALSKYKIVIEGEVSQLSRQYAKTIESVSQIKSYPRMPGVKRATEKLSFLRNKANKELLEKWMQYLQIDMTLDLEDIPKFDSPQTYYKRSDIQNDPSLINIVSIELSKYSASIKSVQNNLKNRDWTEPGNAAVLDKMQEDILSCRTSALKWLDELGLQVPHKSGLRELYRAAMADFSYLGSLGHELEAGIEKAETIAVESRIGAARIAIDEIDLTKSNYPGVLKEARTKYLTGPDTDETATLHERINTLLDMHSMVSNIPKAATEVIMSIDGVNRYGKAIAVYAAAVDSIEAQAGDLANDHQPTSKLIISHKSKIESLRKDFNSTAADYISSNLEELVDCLEILENNDTDEFNTNSAYGLLSDLNSCMDECIALRDNGHTKDIFQDKAVVVPDFEEVAAAYAKTPIATLKEEVSEAKKTQLKMSRLRSGGVDTDYIIDKQYIVQGLREELG